MGESKQIKILSLKFMEWGRCGEFSVRGVQCSTVGELKQIKILNLKS
jgi:hypothetical protein